MTYSSRPNLCFDSRSGATNRGCRASRSIGHVLGALAQRETQLARRLTNAGMPHRAAYASVWIITLSGLGGLILLHAILTGAVVAALRISVCVLYLSDPERFADQNV
jgi:hypothetical protein